eukprot:UN09806
MHYMGIKDAEMQQTLLEIAHRYHTDPHGRELIANTFAPSVEERWGGAVDATLPKARTTAPRATAKRQSVAPKEVVNYNYNYNNNHYNNSSRSYNSSNTCPPSTTSRCCCTK